MSIGPVGSPVPNPEVGSTLPTNQAFQPNSEPVCQTIQISSPVAAVANVVKEQELKSNFIFSVFCLFG